MAESSWRFGGAESRVGARTGRGVVLALLAMVPALAFAALSLRGVSLNLFEDGTTIAGGLRIFAGEAPYRDFFAFYGPLTYVLPAGVFRVTGSVTTAVVIYYAVISCATSLVAYLLARRISGRPVLALIVPAALVLLNATQTRSLPALAAVLALMAYERSLRRRWMVVAGAAISVALLWVQDSGAWLVVALLVAWAGSALMPEVRRVLTARSVGLAAAGALLAASPWLVFAGVKGFLGDWLYWTYVFPNTTYTHRDATGYLIGLVRSWGGEGPLTLGYHVLFYLFPYIAVFSIAVLNIVVAVTRLRKASRGQVNVPVGTFVLAVYGLLQLRVLAASLDEPKLADSLTPAVVCALGLALGALPLVHRPSALRPRWWVTSAATLCLAWFVLWPVQKAAHGLDVSGPAQTASATGSLGGIPLAGASPAASTPAELTELRAVIDADVAPGGRILVLPTSPMIYAIADRLDATPYDYLDPVYTTSAVDETIAASVRARLPELVVVGNNTFPTGPSGSEIAPRTYAAVAENYDARTTIGPWTVYERRAAGS